MERKLQQLDSFRARGSDGITYKVIAYEHLVRDESSVLDGLDHWEPTGQAEYRLAEGQPVEVGSDGVLRVAATGVELHTEGKT